jgi:histidinol-phosphatase
MNWDAELRFAHRLADVADEITMRGFVDRVGARMKIDGTPVTEADEAAERALRSEIAKAFPDHAVLGEEEGPAGSGPTRWILDPIDGTKNYAAGIPIWGTLIALEVEGEVVCGVVSAPALRERYAAARGAGAECNGEPIRVSSVSELPAARITYTSFLSFDDCGRGDAWRRLAGAASWARGFGDFWGHMLVASGRADVMAEPVVNVWDLAPLLVIVEEAGGRFTDLDGSRRIDGGSAVTTNGHLHDAVIDVFSGRS